MSRAEETESERILIRVADGEVGKEQWVGDRQKETDEENDDVQLKGRTESTRFFVMKGFC